MSALHGASRRSLDAAPMRRRAYVFVLSGRIESEGPAERFFTGEVKLKRLLRPDVPPRTSKCSSLPSAVPSVPPRQVFAQQASVTYPVIEASLYDLPGTLI